MSGEPGCEIEIEIGDFVIWIVDEIVIWSASRRVVWIEILDGRIFAFCDGGMTAIPAEQLFKP